MIPFGDIANTHQMILQDHQRYMAMAITQASIALEKNEVPVGAIIVHDDMVIGKGHNQVETLKDATAHAEMIALTAAMEHRNQKYLQGCTIYVTLEPCPMCAGALVWSKIDRIVFGAMDAKAGGCGSLFNISANKQLNHQIEIIQGVLEEDAKWLLKQFFAEKRN